MKKFPYDRNIFFPVFFVLFAILGWAASGSAQQNLQTFRCTPTQVGNYKTYTVGTQTYTGRVWVQCNPPLSTNQKFFAVPLSDAAEAARFLSLFTAAFVAGKTIDIGYISTDNTGPNFNCTATTECWPALSANIQ